MLATSAKLGLSSPSTSLMLIDPVTVTGASPTSPSVTAPVTVPDITEASSVPVIATVTTCVEPSVAVKVMVSLTTSPASRSCTADWSSVYVQAPDTNAKLPKPLSPAVLTTSAKLGLSSAIHIADGNRTGGRHRRITDVAFAHRTGDRAR